MGLSSFLIRFLVLVWNDGPTIDSFLSAERWTRIESNASWGFAFHYWTIFGLLTSYLYHRILRLELPTYQHGTAKRDRMVVSY